MFVKTNACAASFIYTLIIFTGCCTCSSSFTPQSQQSPKCAYFIVFFLYNIGRVWRLLSTSEASTSIIPRARCRSFVTSKNFFSLFCVFIILFSFVRFKLIVSVVRRGYRRIIDCFHLMKAHSAVFSSPRSRKISSRIVLQKVYKNWDITCKDVTSKATR